MSALLEEYGEALIACIIAAILLPFIMFTVKNAYQKVYPDYNNESMETINQNLIKNSGSPELVANEAVRIRKGDLSYSTRTYMSNPNSTEYKNALNKYKALAIAYKTGTGDQNNKDTVIPVEVYGTENIDVNNFGAVYTILFKATNQNGHTTTKEMKVLIG